MLLHGAFQVAAEHRKESEGRALQEIHAKLSQLIAEYSPDAVAVESVFSALNVRTALRLAEVRGVVLLAAAQHGLEVHSYAPREVKASIAGHGHADKRQMQLMVRALLAMEVTPEPADAADALAVALCHLQMEQARQRYGLPQTKSAAGARAIATAVAVAGKAPLRTGSATRLRSTRILHSL